MKLSWGKDDAERPRFLTAGLLLVASGPINGCELLLGVQGQGILPLFCLYLAAVKCYIKLFRQLRLSGLKYRWSCVSSVKHDPASAYISKSFVTMRRVVSLLCGLRNLDWNFNQKCYVGLSWVKVVLAPPFFEDLWNERELRLIKIFLFNNCWFV